ncbi:hypothetical protein [Dactylosporangium salmoneum]|uniref:Band 7 domain-containing protein n=1 Tax=Dactylosporangium salmoneum TaxID=53361 RepID=A0ABN3I1W2_9ACTN
MGLILSKVPLHRFRFGTSTPARAGVQLVVETAGGRFEAITGQRTVGERMFAPHSVQYEIDMTAKVTPIDMPVKTRDEKYDFHVRLEIRWQVSDAAEVARVGLDDGSSLVSAVVRDRLKELGRRFGIDQTLAFEQSIRQSLTEPGVRAVKSCLWIESVSPEVSLDEAGRTQLANIRDVEGKTAVLNAQHVHDTTQQRHQDEIARMRASQEIERDKLKQQFDLEAKRLEEEFEREQQVRREQHAEAVRRSEMEWKAAFDRREREQQIAWQREEEQRQDEREAARTKRFLDAMERGDAAVLALHLGRHPDDTKEIVQMIVNNKAIAEERQAKILADMIDKNLIIGADLEGVSQDLIRVVAGMMSRPSAGVFSLNTTVEVGMDALAAKKPAEITSTDAHGDASPEPTGTADA